jgi:hypothetical protein
MGISQNVDRLGLKRLIEIKENQYRSKDAKRSKEEMLLLSFLNKEYYCDNLGNIYSNKTQQKRQIRNNKKCSLVVRRYIECGFYLEGCRFLFKAHRAIYIYFNGLILKGYTINHKDGNKHNNCIENLEAVTQKENILHAWKTGLSRSHNTPIKLSKDNVLNIKERLKNKETLSSIAKIHNISISMVSNIKRGISWK